MCYYIPILFSIRNILAFSSAIPFVVLPHILLSFLIFSFPLQSLDISTYSALLPNI